MQQERTVMQTRLQGLVRETAEASKSETESSQALRRQLEALRSEHSAQQKALQQALEERSREVAELTAQQDVLQQQVRGLHQHTRRHEPPTKEIATDHKITQTINLEVDLKVKKTEIYVFFFNQKCRCNKIIFFLFEVKNIYFVSASRGNC